MNTSEQIINVLNALCTKIGVSIDWTSTNVLPYLQTLCEQYAKYVMASSIFYIVFMGIMLLIIGAGLLRYVYKKRNDIDWEFDVWQIFVLIFAGFLVLIGLVVIWINVANIIKTIIIPEALITDYVKNILIQ